MNAEATEGGNATIDAAGGGGGGGLGYVLTIGDALSLSDDAAIEPAAQPWPP